MINSENSFYYAKHYLKRPVYSEVNGRVMDYGKVYDDPYWDDILESFSADPHTRHLFNKFGRKKGILRGELFGWKIEEAERSKRELGLDKPKFRPNGVGI